MDRWATEDPLGAALQFLRMEGAFYCRSELTAPCGGAPTTMICGAVTFEHPAARNLVGMLPALIHLEAAGDWLTGTLRLLASETRALRAGSETVITRLSDILVIQALRAWIEDDPGAQTGWLGALRDP